MVRDVDIDKVRRVASRLSSHDLDWVQAAIRQAIDMGPDIRTRVLGMLRKRIIREQGFGTRCLRLRAAIVRLNNDQLIWLSDNDPRPRSKRTIRTGRR